MGMVITGPSTGPIMPVTTGPVGTIVTITTTAASIGTVIGEMVANLARVGRNGGRSSGSARELASVLEHLGTPGPYPGIARECVSRWLPLSGKSRFGTG